MRCRCPHCHNPIELVDDAELSDIPCPSCGSSFSLVPSETVTYDAKGQSIAHFELIEKLGAGAFGSVWKAKDTQLDRTVAIKIPRKEQLDTQETEQFLREARAAAQLRHPNIVTVHEIGREDDQVYIASDYIEGATLSDWVTGRQPSPREAAGLCAKIAAALHHAHEAGVIHRDLKPSNIMMDLDGEPHIMDFGLAKREAGEITMTMEGRVIGTPAYMSPEQARGEGHHADRRSDIYSLGVVLFQLLTNELPFRGNPRMLVVQILKDDPPSPRQLNGAIARDLETICLKCLEKEPDRRPETAKALADDLRRYLAGEPITARRVGNVEILWRWSWRHPARAGLLAAIAVAALLTVGLAVGFGYQRRLEYSNESLTKSLSRERELGNELGESREDLERLLYFRRVSQALVAWHDNEIGRTEQLLRDCPPHLRHWEWHYVDSLLRSGVQTISSQPGWVSSLALSPDEKRIAHGAESDVRVWDTGSREQLFRLRGHAGRVASVVYSPSGKRLVSGSVDKTAKVWDTETGHLLFTLAGHDAAIRHLAFSANEKWIVTASHDDPSMRVWDAKNGKLARVLAAASVGVSAVVLSPDGRRILSDSRDHTQRLWDAETGRELMTTSAPIGAFHGLAFSPDGRRFTTPDKQTTVAVWDTETAEKVFVLQGHNNRVQAAAFSPDGKWIATASLDQTAKLWNAENGEEVFTLQGHRHYVSGVRFTADSKRVLTNSHDNSIKVWAVDSGREVTTLKGHTDAVTHIAVANDGKLIVSASRDGTVRAWDAESGREASTLHGNPVPVFSPTAYPIVALALSTDGRLLASAVGSNSIKVWDAELKRFILTLNGHTDVVTSLAVTADGGRLVSAGFDTAIGVWNTTTGQRLLALTGHENRIKCVALSPDGKRIASGEQGGAVKVWNAETGKEIRTLHQRTADGVTSIAFSPDGKWVVGGGADRPAPLTIWNAETGDEKFVFDGHQYRIRGLGFSTDSEHLASGAWDNSVRVWRLSDGEALFTLNAGGWVNSVAVSPDGKRVVAACQRGAVKIWDAESGHESLTLKGHTHSVDSVLFSADGQRIISGSRDGTIRIWDAGTTEFIHHSD